MEANLQGLLSRRSLAKGSVVRVSNAIVKAKREINDGFSGTCSKLAIEIELGTVKTKKKEVLRASDSKPVEKTFAWFFSFAAKWKKEVSKP